MNKLSLKVVKKTESLNKKLNAKQKNRTTGKKKNYKIAHIPNFGC
jgi:hypothetical protein